jgi:DNA (cytosine-5)-methyltransferase 1
MRYLSVCSGIEAASVAWKPLGWKAVAFSEIEPFPCAVLAHHYPEVPNWGDMTKFQDWPDAAIELLVGGTPCQAFSVAGLRKGLADPRGNLTLTYLAVAAKYRPKWLVWENVPGVLSDGTGAFGSFLGGLAELGYGFAYRILDAQYFGVPQRRRRVFVVGCLGDWRSAAAVLFERHSLQGNPAPSRETREGIAGTIGARTGRSVGAQDAACGHMMAHSLKADGFDASEDGTGRGTPIIPHTVGALTDGAHMGGGLTARTLTQDELSRCLNAGGMGRQDWETETLVVEPTGGGFDAKPIAHVETMPTLRAAAAADGPGHSARSGDSKDEYIVPMTLAIRGRGDSHDLEYRQDGTANAILTPNGGRAGIGVGAVAFAQNQRDELRTMDVAGALASEPGMKQQTYLHQAMSVRRLTPRECDRLQGFPDDYELVPYRNKPAADGPRYKALGNSMAVPVMAWIGQRIATVEALA